MSAQEKKKNDGATTASTAGYLPKGYVFIGSKKGDMIFRQAPQRNSSMPILIVCNGKELFQ